MKITEIKEFHQTGHLSIENLDHILSNTNHQSCDVGIQIDADGRIWLCVDGLAFVRFKPQKTTCQISTDQTSTEAEANSGNDNDYCGLCGKPGADKYAHPKHWPGERIPNRPLVHTECEEQECKRACQEFYNRGGEKDANAFWKNF